MVLQALKANVRKSLMDEMLIFRKMESLGMCVDRIRSKCGFTHEELLHDYDLQDILSVNESGRYE